MLEVSERKKHETNQAGFHPKIAYDGENQLKSTGGVTYTYDGKSRRVQKFNGKLYWYGTSSLPLNESDASGNIYCHFADRLGAARVVTSSAGSVLDSSNFCLFGGERPFLLSSGNTYKFESKERDAETGNNYFGARFYASRYGRFPSMDWSAVPAPVPYANLSNPQTLNLFSFAATTATNSPGREIISSAKQFNLIPRALTSKCPVAPQAG